MAKYKVTYFPWKGGGEIIRLALAQAGQDFEDERITKEDWPKLKPNAPMQQMPMLTLRLEDRTVAVGQSGSIVKYIARKYEFMGSSAEEDLLVDEVFDSTMDAARDFAKLVFAVDEQTKKEARDKFTQQSVPRFAEFFKRRRADYGANGFIIGCKLSLADIQVFNFVDQTSGRGFGHLWDAYPEIRQHETLVKSQQNIAAWLARRPTE